MRCQPETGAPASTASAAANGPLATIRNFNCVCGKKSNCELASPTRSVSGEAPGRSAVISSVAIDGRSTGSMVIGPSQSSPPVIDSFTGSASGGSS